MTVDDLPHNATEPSHDLVHELGRKLVHRTQSTNEDTSLQHQLFEGTTWHSRLLPKVNKFVYPYRYWGINISALAVGRLLPEISTATLDDSTAVSKRAWKKVLPRTLWTLRLPLFSSTKKALQRFCPDDYLQGFDSDTINSTDSTNNANSLSDDDSQSVQALHQRLNQAFATHAGSMPAGDIVGLVVCRNAGLYFSPVNFYLGFDAQQTPTHLLAEVSNTPWDKRHYYGFLLEGAETEFCHDKDFHVSPFNPIDQLYRWQVTVKQPQQDSATAHEDDADVHEGRAGTQADTGLQVRIAINISDERGEVLKTGIKLSGIPMTEHNVRHSLHKNPLMNMTSLMRIYWHAFKLYALKKVPYINYDEKLADSQQYSDSIKSTDRKFSKDP